jgi:hypothetical protein
VSSVQLRFELGDPETPRGHAILFARISGNPQRVIATYCVLLPIQFSIGKYLPPILSGQMPLEGLGDASAPAAVPIPPMLEDVAGSASLRQLAERRGDDLCELGTLQLSDDGQRMAYAAEACQAYAQLYADYMSHWPAVSDVVPDARDDLDVDSVLDEVLTERDRIGEIARLIGQARYAVEGHDARLLDDVSKSLHRHARALPEKYRAEQLVAAALRTDGTGPRLAELYLQRAYKLLGEDYADIPPIENEIRSLLQPPESGAPTSNES